MADEKTTEQLKRIIQLLQQIVGQNVTNLANQATIIDQNNQIIKLLTPAPDNDIRSLGGSISTPKKK